jgi:arylamine N-acetyltransferase
VRHYGEPVERYLSILGCDRLPPTLENLRRLVRAQIVAVPFENISKLSLRAARSATKIPTLDEHLDGIERHRFGGTCYANNSYLAWLLQQLGYEVTIHGAAMSRPDVHMVSIVRLEGRHYLVDCGYSAPFFEPMPLDLDRELEIFWGRARYVLHPRDADGRSRMDLYRDEELIHGYTVDPTPRKLEHFETEISESYSERATFMKVAVVERFFDDRSVRYHNFTVTESRRESSRVITLPNRDALASAIASGTGMTLAVVRKALEGLPLDGDIYT